MKPTPEQVAAAKAYARGTETPMQYALLRGPDTAIGPNHVTEILLAALVRDARRFRKLAAHYCGSGRPEHGAIQLERWDAEWMDWVPLSDQPLAEIADALPEVEG